MSKAPKLGIAARAATAARAAAGTSGPDDARPIRTTIDLSPVHHQALTAFTADAQAQLGLPRLHQSRVWRALLDELDSNPDLARRVLDRIREQ